MPHESGVNDDAFALGYGEEEINFDNDFKSEEDVTAPEYPAEGIYHVSLQSVDSSGKSFPGAVFLGFEILTGNVANQGGRLIRHAIWPVATNAKNPESAKRRWKKDVLRLMLALGVRKAGEFPTVRFNDEWWESLEGKQCVILVTHTAKKRVTDAGKEIEWISAEISKREHMFAIGSEEVQGIPIDTEAASIGGYLGSEGDI